MSSKEFLSGLKKEDRLMPVKTIVISYDAEKWDGARTLHEMLDWRDIPDDIKEEIPDYEITLIQPGDLSDEVLKKLPSSFGNLMGFIKYSRDAEKLEQFVEENEESFRHFSMDALAVINAFCNLDHLNIEEYEEGGECDMCQAITDIMAREKKAGVSEGKAVGLAEGKAVGLAEGKAVGLAEGKAVGLAEGKAVGLAEGKITILANLVVNGFIPFDVALSQSGLSKEEFIAEAASFDIIIKL